MLNFAVQLSGLFHGVMVALQFLVLSVPVRIGVEQHSIALPR